MHYKILSPMWIILRCVKTPKNIYCGGVKIKIPCIHLEIFHCIIKYLLRSTNKKTWGRHPARILPFQKKCISKTQEQLISERWTANPFILTCSTSFGVLVGIFARWYIRSRASSHGWLHFIPPRVHPLEKPDFLLIKLL